MTQPPAPSSSGNPPSRPSLFGPSGAAKAGGPKPTDPARVQADAQRLLAAIERPGGEAAGPKRSRAPLVAAGAAVVTLVLAWGGWQALRGEPGGDPAAVTLARPATPPAAAQPAPNTRAAASPATAAAASAAAASAAASASAVARLEDLPGATPLAPQGAGVAASAPAVAAATEPKGPEAPVKSASKARPSAGNAARPRSDTAAAPTAAAKSATTTRGKTAPSRDVAGETQALVARAEAMEARRNPEAAAPRAQTAGGDPDVELLAALMSHMSDRGPSRKDAAGNLPTIAQLVEQCATLPSKADRMACGQRICDGYWGKAEACPTRRGPAAEAARADKP